ncbi:MAG: TetR/AcrR family transcriptional regulator [Xanthobacteraceae bacterium]
MRVTKKQQEKNRERLVAAAARLMRKRGISGIGIDALAKAAGVTHGAVYSHFADKDELAAAAISHAIAETSESWREAASAIGPPGSAVYVNELIRQYVSRQHRDRPDEGCAVVALGPDAIRQGRKVRRAVSDRVKALSEDLRETDPKEDAAEAESRAVVTMAAMVGAVLLSRAVEDPAFSDRILLTVRRSLTRMQRTGTA